MNSVKSRSTEEHGTPVALSRSSIKSDRQSRAQCLSSTDSNNYSNIVTHDHATSIDINSSVHLNETRAQNVQLVVAGNQNASKNKSEEQDIDCLIDEYQILLRRKDCANRDCHRLKLLSYKISQALFERINSLKQTLNSRQQDSTTDKVIEQLESSEMDNQRLAGLIDERDRRIQVLERLVEDQRRLRMQDATQVEEKAARIKEWVANKLKELENQNKQLREQNQRQKEVVELLNSKLTSASHLCSPIRTKNIDSKNALDQVSPFQTLDVNKSLRLRRPQLKGTFQSSSSLTTDERLSSHTAYPYSQVYHVSTEKSYPIHNPNARSSPIYDSVTAEQITKQHAGSLENLPHEQMVSNKESDHPPPPPMHQTEIWERELYTMVDEMSLDHNHKEQDDNQNNLDSIDSSYDRDAASSNASSSQKGNTLTSLLKPLYKTIDGDQVIDTSLDVDVSFNKSDYSYSMDRPRSIDENGSISSPRKNSAASQDRSIVTNLFDSPMRSRAGKESILRTQSVRRNPAPERLYDFVAADLVKRGNLTKPGTLKSHQRWVVLKNFQLLIFKNESDETDKATPTFEIRLRPNFYVMLVNQTSEAHYPFKLQHNEKSLQLIAESPQLRDEWIRILTIAITTSELEPESLKKQNSVLESLISFTRQGHTKRSFAILVSNVVFFLKSASDPTPIGYLPIIGSRIREVTDINDYDSEEQEIMKTRSHIQDCCIAIYPKFTLSPDPVYITFGNQKETDCWLQHLTDISGVNQAHGTKFEQSLSRFMMSNSTREPSILTDSGSGCIWKNNSALVYSSSAINEPLTSLPNETLRNEALELFRSILLFTQVPIELIAIDYHVSLLQNCMCRFLKHPELRNELFAQLLKQCTYIDHHCGSSKSSSCSSGCSSINHRSSLSSLSPTYSECQVVSDLEILESIAHRRKRLDTSSTLSHLNSLRDRTESSVDELNPPTKSELLQTIQVISIAVSLSLPRGRMRWWLVDCLQRYTDSTSQLGKYALYALQAIERTTRNGVRDNVPSRMEIMSILSRNPYDHSSPHSLPVSFSDSSYLVVGVDGSTTVEEFMALMGKNIDIRESTASDFYLFADDPADSKELHILEPQRKIMDIVGWWEQIYRRHNSGKYQNTKAIKLMCKKRLLFKAEQGETQQERLLIVHQMNHEVMNHRIPLTEQLVVELGALMAQMNYGDCKDTDNSVIQENLLSNIAEKYLPSNPSHSDTDNRLLDLLDRWKNLTGKSSPECARVYLNCFRRLKFASG